MEDLELVTGTKCAPSRMRWHYVAIKRSLTRRVITAGPPRWLIFSSSLLEQVQLIHKLFIAEYQPSYAAVIEFNDISLATRLCFIVEDVLHCCCIEDILLQFKYLDILYKWIYT